VFVRFIAAFADTLKAGRARHADCRLANRITLGNSGDTGSAQDGGQRLSPADRAVGPRPRSGAGFGSSFTEATIFTRLAASYKV
jgi:hypothetical protein